jgi:dethiobiotin synthetase
LPALQEQVAGITNAVEWYSDVIVEGAGGVLVRLGDVWSLLDLAQAVAHARHEVRVLVVARAGLGTLNHTALTVDAITGRELYVPGVVMGAWPDEPDLAARQNVEDLPRLTGVPIVGSIPDGAGALDSAAFTAAVPGWLAALEG